jgi:hypothetical protein
MALQNISGHQHKHIYDINEKYGKLARIGPNQLISSDPEILMRMSATNSPYRRSAFYTTFRMQPREDNVFSTRDEKRHTEIRRKVALGYGGKDVPHLETQIERHIAAWVDLIKRKYLSTETETKAADLSKQAQYFTLDVITDVAIDNSFGDLELDQDRYNFAQGMKDMFCIIQLLTVFTDVFTFLEQSRIMDLISPSPKDKYGPGPVLNMAKESIAKRFQEPELKQKPDMLGAWLRSGMTQEDLEREALIPLY